ncbi:unnamed protein product [Rotaria socialis]|uniref:USP domain-containing protein n=2 Tax=Rotaria socialis TaxID=392032 RepID=A0A818MRS3_9BILA|nr:unnamed protein product [Rotaria socialis]CAF4474963.1 unnamed protein product [Rotaria socialis]
MQPPCALCSTLLPILEKYASLELIEAIDLQKDDICTFVSYVSNWPQTRCACLCRDATTIERFSSLVEWLLLYVINLLQTFTIAESLPDEDISNQLNESDSLTQICSILTTTDQEQQRQYRQWTLEEKERLLLCVARCFTLNLPIYSAAHRNPSLAHHVAYYQMQHASADFKTFLSSYCHLNLSSNHANGNNDSHHVSLYLYRQICSFCENRGLIVIRQVFESAKNTRMLPLSIAHALFVILTNLRHHLNIDIIKNFLLPIRPHAIRYMCLLSDNELRLCGQKNTNDLLYASLKDLFLTTTFRQRSTSSTSGLSPYNPKHHHTIQFQRYHFDRLMLTLALKYLTCSTLTIRLTGLSHITNQIQQCLDYTQYRRHQSMAAAAAAAAAASCCSHANTTQEIFTVSESDGEDETSQKITNDVTSSSASSTDDNDEYSSHNHHERKLANWIIENKIIDYLFGPNLHTELLKQCLTILIFLASNNRLTVEHIDLIWSCVSLTHCSRHILDLLMNLGQKNLNIHLLNHLLQLIGRSDRSQYTESTLTLISILTKSYWSQLIRSSNTIMQNKKQQELTMKQKFHQRNSLNMQNILRKQKTLKRQQISPLKRIDRTKNVVMIRHRARVQHKNTPHLIRQTSPSSPPSMPRSIAVKKQPLQQQQQPVKVGSVDEDSAEEVIIVGSPQQPTLTEQNVLKLMANKCKEFPSQNILKSNPSSGYVLRPEKKTDDPNNANTVDEWTDDEDDEDEDENNDEQLRNASAAVRRTIPFNRTVEPTSSNDEEDDDESETETHLISREVLMQHRERFQRGTPANQEESDDDEAMNNMNPNLSQMYKPEDLSTPTKRPTSGSGFIINNSKTLVLPDDQMDIDDDEDDQNEIFEEDLRGMVLPTVVQSSLKQQINRKAKQQQQQQQQLAKEARQQQDDEENNTDHEINSTRKKYQQKVGSPESAEDASQAGSLPSEMETEIYDCRESIGPKKKRPRPNIDDGDDDDEDDEEEEEEEEGDFGSSVSDVLSGTGSAKNMADFEDMSESEQQTTSARRIRINHQLSDIASSTPTDQQTRKRQDTETNLGHHTSSSSSASSSTESTNGSSTGGNIDDDEINISNLSLPGQTLLWDLLQDQTIINLTHLPDSLLNETERLFSHVLSSIEDKRILLHFIQACLDNLKKSTSSLISLRLLPKLFLIFQQHQQRANTHIFLLFEEKYHVLNAFFNDLEQLTKRLQANTSLISIHNEITVRFQFLSFIFSISASPKDFNLTQSQADRLWDCLTAVTGSTGTNREELYNWLLSQLKNRDGGHALSLETFKHLLTEKLLTQKPEHVCGQQLNLIQEILQQSRTNWVHILQQQQQQQTSSTTNLTQQYNDFQTFEFLILNYVNDVAMRALDQNVSTLAAQTLNSYQIQNEDGTLDREEPFIARCMNCLNECINTLDDLSSLRTINRISVLLRSHLELFMRRYSYVIRLYQYISQTNSTTSNNLFSSSSLKPHIKQLTLPDERETNMLKLICNAPITSGGTEKYILKMSPNEFIGDLRAELTRWYCTLKPPMTNVLTQTLLTIEKNDLTTLNSTSLSASSSGSSFDLLHMSNLPSIRVLANGQELDRDIDDKTLSECNIKDNQTILINASTRNRTKDLYNIDERLLKNYIPHKMPMMLLLKYIEQFFSILAQLQNFIETSSEHAEARLAVSRLWEILLLIPTHSGIFQNLSQLNEFKENENNTVQWANCLKRSDPFRLTYSLQIIDMLIRRMPAYKDIFVSKGGLKYLYDLFVSKSFFTEPIDRSWCSGLPDALLYTLKILCSCLLKIPTPSSQSSGQQQQQPPPPSSAPPSTIPTAADEQHSPRTPVNTRKKTRRETTTPAIMAALSSSDLINIDNSTSTPIVHQQSHFHIYEPHWDNVALTDKEVLLDTLIDIQLSIVTKSTRLCCPVVLLQFANRTDLLHTSMILFITLCHSYDDIRAKFIEHPKLSLWLKILLLDAYDSILKREAQLNIYRLCIVSSNNNNSNSSNSSGTSEELSLQPTADFPPPPPMPTQRTCPIDEEKAAQTLTISSSIESTNEPAVERICLVPILTNLLELIPYALKFTSSSSSSSQNNFETNSAITFQTLNLSSTLMAKYDSHSLFLNQSSHEYFHLLTSIIDRMHYDEIKQIKISKNKLCNINNSNQIILFDHELIEILINFIHDHIPYETQRDKLIEDEVLYGLLCLLTSIVKQYNNLYLKQININNNPSYKQLTFTLIDRVFKYLFELPTSENRFVPKCKSLLTRAKSYEFLNELIKVNQENFIQLQKKLLDQHNSIDRQQPYIWDYWPRDDGRSYSGYVGLTNLGATCYAATSLQHLYMIPELRTAILNTDTADKHDLILYELKRMFAYLLESERRSYNPKSFCKVYTMDGLQSLNTGDQKDMTEFFTDLITKLEEMSDDLKQLVRDLFCGILTNIVISFDCPHISRKLEEFYTVRCQVADMKDVHESLAELTVKDTLEGDNMYTCSKCSKKVRAEKRVCFRKLPKILCLNTMRYTFNMVTMQREKVNTLFQFPMQLDMSGYMETNLIDKNKLIGDGNPEHDEEKDSESTSKYPPASPSSGNDSHLFELIGVTVHTGTAEGGHYYSFIRERVKRSTDNNNFSSNSDLLLDNQQQCQQHRWYLFNDAEVKQFDPSQIANECFGGEITSKGYDQGSDRFLDFQFEKTHSAYMLFYERIDTPSTITTTSNIPTLQLKDSIPYAIPKDISDWIWEDNRRFVRDRHLFDHHYFTFMWTLCHHPAPVNTLVIKQDDQQEPSDKSGSITESYDMLPMQLAITFVFETYIHAKDKPTMTGWVEYLCKQFTACKPVAVWFLAHMTQDDTWLTKVLVRCPNHTIRHMFARVLIDVLHKSRFRDSSNEDSLVVQQFIRKYLLIISEGGARLSIRYMSEYFVFLHDFARNGIDECYLLLDCLCIQQLITFYMLHRGRQPKQSSSNNNNNDDGNTSSDDENQSSTNLLMTTNVIDDDIIPLNTIRLPANNNLNRPGIFEKMFPLIALLLETERTRSNLENFDLHLFVENDFAFIQQQILDNINLKATAHIIQLICYKNDVYANKIVNLLSQWITNYKNDMNSVQALFKVLTYLIEQNPNNITNENNDQQQVLSTLNIDKNWCDFAALIVIRIGKLIDICPTQVFEWFNNVVNKSSIIHRWIYNNIKQWLKPYLLYNTYTKVRTLMAQLLVALVPSAIFRQTYRTGKYFLNLSKQQLASATQTTTTHGTITSLLTLNQQISPVSNTTSFSALFDHLQFAQYPSDFTTDTYSILRTLLSHLLELLIEIGHDQNELHMNDNQQRLVQYLSVVIHFTRYTPEKCTLSESHYLHALCTLISHPKLTEDHTINNGNKLLIFILLQQLLTEKIFLTNTLTYEHDFKQQLPMCLIIVDHEDQELILYNRLFLFIYYNILKQICQYSWLYSKELALHKNMSWALKNVLPYVHLYPDACEQLSTICKIISRANRDNLTVDDQQLIIEFKKELYSLIYRFNDIRSSWSIILDLTRDMCDLQASHDERFQILTRRGLPVLTTIFLTIFTSYHDQTQTQISTIQNDLIYLLCLIANLLDTADIHIKKPQTNSTTNMRNIVGTQWKEKMELVAKLLLLLNSYNSSEIRQRAFDLLKKVIVQLTIQDLTQVASHIKTTHEQAASQSHPQLGPYFPRRKQPINNSQQQGTIDHIGNQSVHTPFRPHFGMYFKTQLLETSKGRDLDFDRAVHAYYSPYHFFIDSLARYAYNQNSLSGSILNLVTLVACEGVQSMHLCLFAKLCLEISNQSTTSAQTLIHDLLQTSSSYYFHHFIEIVLIDERISLYQIDNYSFLYTYLPMILSMKKSSAPTTPTSSATAAATAANITTDSIQMFIQRLEQLLNKTCEHCLQSIFNESQTNLDWLQSYKKLLKSINYSNTQIIGDVKALEIYLHCQLTNDKSKIQTIIEQSIRFIEQHLQLPLLIDDELQQQQQQESESTTIVDDEANPVKRRRLDDSNLAMDITNNDPKRKTIVDTLQILQTFLTNMNNITNESTTIEQ